jgi:hypothetical protein
MIPPTFYPTLSMSPATVSVSFEERISQLEERAATLEREAGDELTPGSRRVDAHVAAVECHQSANRLRQCRGIPTVEHLLAAADVLADSFGQQTRFTSMLQRDALLIARLTEASEAHAGRDSIEAEGHCFASWEAGFHHATEMIRTRLRAGPATA